ncbi:hypothetical protein WDU94_002762 [Cyamophila willieti]
MNLKNINRDVEFDQFKTSQCEDLYGVQSKFKRNVPSVYDVVEHMDAPPGVLTEWDELDNALPAVKICPEPDASLAELFTYLDDFNDKALEKLLFQIEGPKSLAEFVEKLKTYQHRELKKLRTPHVKLLKTLVKRNLERVAKKRRDRMFRESDSDSSDEINLILPDAVTKRQTVREPFGPRLAVQYKFVTFLIRVLTDLRVRVLYSCLVAREEDPRNDDPATFRYDVMFEFLSEVVKSQPKELKKARKRLDETRKEELNKLLGIEEDEDSDDEEEEEEFGGGEMEGGGEEGEGEEGEGQKDKKLELDEEERGEEELVLSDKDKYVKLINLLNTGSWEGEMEIFTKPEEEQVVQETTVANIVIPVPELKPFPFAKMYRSFVQVLWKNFKYRNQKPQKMEVETEKEVEPEKEKEGSEEASEISDEKIEKEEEEMEIMSEIEENLEAGFSQGTLDLEPSEIKEEDSEELRFLKRIEELDLRFEKKRVPWYGKEKKDLYQLYLLIKMILEAEWKSCWLEWFETLEIDLMAEIDAANTPPPPPTPSKKGKQKKKKQQNDIPKPIVLTVLPKVLAYSTRSPFTQLLNILIEFLNDNRISTIDAMKIPEDKLEKLENILQTEEPVYDYPLSVTHPHPPIVIKENFSARETEDLIKLKSILIIFLEADWQRRYMARKAHYNVITYQRLQQERMKQEELTTQDQQRIRDVKNKIQGKIDKAAQVAEEKRLKDHDPLEIKCVSLPKKTQKIVHFANPVVQSIDGLPFTCHEGELLIRLRQATIKTYLKYPDIRVFQSPAEQEPIDSLELRILKKFLYPDLTVAPKKKHRHTRNIKHTDFLPEIGKKFLRKAKEDSVYPLEPIRIRKEETVKQFIRYELLETVKNMIDFEELLNTDTEYLNILKHVYLAVAGSKVKIRLA